MNIIDTHAHIDMPEFEKDIKVVIKKALNKGIKKIFIPSVNSISAYKILKLNKKYPKVCYPMIGLHPNYVYINTLKKELNKIKKLLNFYNPISIGEIGIDLYSNKHTFYEQKYAFIKQLKWAEEKKIPVVIHCRESFNEIYKIIKTKNIRGIFHCFTGNLNQAYKIIDIGMKLGIGGIITFKNNNVIKFLKKIDLNNIVLETDSPFLSPHPFRGKRNEPYNLYLIFQKLSKIYDVSEKKIEKIINSNIKNIFKLCL